MNNEIPEIEFKEEHTQETKGFELISLEKLMQQGDFITQEHHNPFALHRVNFNAILLPTKGNVQHKVDFETCNLQAGDCLLITNGQLNAFDPTNKYFGSLILFTNEFINQYCSASSLKHLDDLLNSFSDVKKVDSFETNNQILLQRIQEDSNTTNAEFTNNILANHLTNHLLLIAHQLNNKQQNNHPKKELFHQFRSLVKNNIATTRNAKDYANMLFISTKTLNEICKSINKKTAKQIIDDYIVLEAKKQLIATEKTIKEISFSLGFNEPTNFQKFFKKHVNCTTQQFRTRY